LVRTELGGADGTNSDERRSSAFVKGHWAFLLHDLLEAIACAAVNRICLGLSLKSDFDDIEWLRCQHLPDSSDPAGNEFNPKWNLLTSSDILKDIFYI
jgi:hypothetical protein